MDRPNQYLYYRNDHSILYVDIMTVFILSLVILLAADRIRATIVSGSVDMTFSLYSTTLLFLLTVIPGYELAVAAIFAALLSSLTNIGHIRKAFVNFGSFAFASMAAVFAYNIPSEILVGIILAGAVFEIVNSITLFWGISFFGHVPPKILYEEWKSTIFIGVLPIVGAMSLATANMISPYIFPILVSVFVVAFRPVYIIGRYKIIGCWNVGKAKKHSDFKP